MKKIYLLIITGFLFASASLGQVTITNPTNTTPNLAATYPSLADAITALSGITAITGPVTITLNAGNPQTAPAGGYVIQFVATTTAFDNIIIEGSNNTITSSAALTVGALNDGIFKLIGADHITIRNFIMQENPANTTNVNATNNMTEWGIALLYASTTDGSQNNTIQNNTISLNRSYRNTFGIYSNVRHSATDISTTADITNVSGSNFGNKLYANNISNVDFGVVFVGSSTAAYMDSGNDIGGSSAATGNTFTNWGGNSNALSNYIGVQLNSFCIFVNHQVNENVSYNLLTSAVLVGPTFTHGGIFKAYTNGLPSGTIASNITYNTITVSSSNASGAMNGILSQQGNLSTLTINLNNNSILNCVISGAATSAFVGVINSSACGVLNMNNNIVQGLSSASTSGSFTGIQNTGGVGTSLNITGNEVGNAGGGAVTFSSAVSGSIIGIANSGASATTITINNNSIYGISCVSGGNIYGIFSSGGSNSTLNINSNSLINTVISGAAATTNIIGIQNFGAVSSLTINGNVIRSNTSTATTGGFSGIINIGNVVNTLTITNNQIGNAAGGAITYSVATSGTIYGINNSASASTATANVSNNSIDGISLVTSGTFRGILSGGNAGVTTMNNNQLGSVTGSFVSFSGAQSSSVTGVMSDGANASSAMTIQGNDIRGIVNATTATATFQLIVSNTAIASQAVSANTFTNLGLNTSGYVYFIIRNGNMASGASWTCSNNSIVTGFNKTAGGGSVECIYSSSFSVNGSTMVETGNNFSNITLTGATSFWGINNQEGLSAASGPAKTITGNTFNNISGGSGPTTLFQIDQGQSTNLSSNNVSNISGLSGVYGVYFNPTSGTGVHNISSNTFSTMSSTGSNVFGLIGGSTNPSNIQINGNTFTGFSINSANSVFGISLDASTLANIYDNNINNFSGTGSGSTAAIGIRIISGTTVNIYRNKITTFLQSGAPTSSPAISGILISGGTMVTIYNNFISDLKVTNASLTDAIRGININSTTANATYNLYFNSIYLNASSAGTNFGTSGIYHTTSATATTAALNMINNIVVNTSTPKGTGGTVAYRRNNNTFTNYASTSDYNLFYAGTPSATRFIYYDGTNFDQSLATYQAKVSPRDANSISLMPNFTSATDLHLTSVNCRINARGTPVAGITTDIDAATRSATTPDIGADEFNPATSSVLAGSTASAVCEDRTVSVAGTNYTSNSCDLIARVLPSGGSPVAGKVNVCVTLDATQQYFNGEPYVQRHFDIEPTTSNQTTTSATITLYFTDAEFVLYNTNNPVWPPLPTAVLGNTDPNRANVKVTQFHGAATTSPSSPGNYPGVRVLINPTLANVFWNGIYWAVTFNVAGFSGFYVHTNNFNAPLPVTVNYFTGTKQGSNHLLNWKVTCNSTPTVTMTLERSTDSRNFIGINSITADAARCNQPFDHTDANPLTGMNYYRLKLADATGKITYSNIIALINAIKGFVLMNIAPNPVVNGNFKLNIASATADNIEVKITDLQGRIIKRQTVRVSAGFNIINMNVSQLARGNYYLSAISAGNKSSILGFMVQ